jgi:hypothetical protein
MPLSASHHAAQKGLHIFVADKFTSTRLCLALRTVASVSSSSLTGAPCLRSKVPSGIFVHPFGVPAEAAFPI